MELILQFQYQKNYCSYLYSYQKYATSQAEEVFHRMQIYRLSLVEKNKHLAISQKYETFHCKCYNAHIDFDIKIAVFNNTSPVLTQLLTVKTITMKTKRLFTINWKFTTMITLTINLITLKMMTNKLKIKTTV